MSEVQRNVEAQVEMYGEPLAEIFVRVRAALGLSQAELARTVGMSPAMLSHLASGTRVKIGNPAVQRRLQEVTTLAGSVTQGEVGADDVPARLETIRASTGSWTTTQHDAPAPAPDLDAAEAGTVRSLLRAVASGVQLQEAAEILDPEHPALAELVRTYGLGSPEAAVEHLRRHRPLF